MFVTPQDYFSRSGARPRKRFGQHFLTQPNTAERIVRDAELDESDVVVEVGPGLGALTRFIVGRVRRVHLVELDRDLAHNLETALTSSGDSVRVHCLDALDFDFLSVGHSEEKALIVLGNLPYNISSPLIFHLLESMAAVNRAVFMVQKEVGERFAAGPGTKDYGVLSVLLGIYARVTKLFSVGADQFYPPPKVESLVVRMDFCPEQAGAHPSFGFMRRFVSAAFQQRRKTLHNSLRGLAGDVDLLDSALERADIEPWRRPETLAPADFFRLGGTLRSLMDVDTSKVGC